MAELNDFKLPPQLLRKLASSDANEVLLEYVTNMLHKYFPEDSLYDIRNAISALVALVR